MERRLKVLHVNTFDYYGGASQIAHGLIDHMNADCTLLVKKKESESDKVIQLEENVLDKLFLTIDKIIWKLNIKKSFKKIFGLSNEYHFTYRKLKKLKEYNQADIIHLHNIHGNYFDLSALKKIASEKPIVWTLHDMWAMTGGEAYTFSNENYRKGIGKTPYLNAYPLDNPIFDRRQHFIELKKELYEKINRKIIFVPVSKWLADCFHSAYVYNKQIKTKVIYNGIDTSIFKNEGNRNWNIPRLLFFHTKSLYKGNELFTSILSKIKGDYELTVIGEPLNTTKLYKHIPYIYNRADLKDAYNNADFLVFPSLAESFGLTVMEALACGVSVIASDAGGIPEVLNNVNGYLFANGDKNDLLEKINYALNNLSESRQKASLASKQIQRSIAQCADRYLELYHDILSPNHT